MFPSDIEVRVIAAPDADYNPDTWWQSRLGLKLFFHELVGYVVAMWEVRRTEPASSSVMRSADWFRLLFARYFGESTRLAPTAHLCVYTAPACTIFQVRAWVRPFIGPGPQPRPGSRLNFLPVFPIVESWEA